MRRFSIRTLLIVTFLVALVVAMPHRQAAKQKRGRAWVAAQRGHVFFKHSIDTTTKQAAIPYVPNFVVSLIGVDYFNSVTGIHLDCEELHNFAALTDVQTLECLSINIELADSIDFSPLKELPNLKEIHFSKWSLLTAKQLAELQVLLPNVQIISEEHDETDRNSR